MSRRVVIGGALGEDVHVAGVIRFLSLAEEAGFRTVFLGAAVSVTSFIQATREHKADLIAVGYRMTPETGEALLIEFKNTVEKSGLKGRFVFGGTPPICERARKLNFFEKCFSGEESDAEVLAFLQGEIAKQASEKEIPQTFVGRLAWKSPFPLIRHHFGLPSLEDTIEGIKKIAESMVLDVISLGVDQDAQENFFHPDRQDPRRRGAGGVPVRSPQEYKMLYEASRRGNFPLTRVYSGTDDQMKLAEMYLETLHNAWCATSIFWFNQLDRRGPLSLNESIQIHQNLMRWHGERNIPVEVNEPHHWGMREAPDVIYVVTSYLSAYNAKKMGVRDYIAQYMFNSPQGLSDKKDLAKVLACIEMSETLVEKDFRIYRQTRTGILSYPVDPSAAKGHVASTVYLQMAVKPHIVHVVGASEADHATTAEELVESVKIARHVVTTALRGIPEMACDPIIQERKHELIEEATVTLNAIKLLSTSRTKDSLTDPDTLARAVEKGVLDAPHLKGTSFAKGEIVTRIVEGACVAVDPDSNKPIDEMRRLEALGFSASELSMGRGD